MYFLQVPELVSNISSLNRWQGGKDEEPSALILKPESPVSVD